MGRKHSKSTQNAAYHLLEEKVGGTTVQRLGADSQLPWGYCPFSLGPIDEGYVSPSGSLYSKEGILEYLLTKAREIKAQMEAFELQESNRRRAIEDDALDIQGRAVQDFIESLDGVAAVVKRKSDDSGHYLNSSKHGAIDEEEEGARRGRRRLLDDRSKEEKTAELSKVAVWLPEFTPTAAPTAVKRPPKRPLSPFSSRELRTKDLISIHLVHDPSESSISSSISSSSSSSSSSSGGGRGGYGGTTKYICPVSKKTITNQTVVFIKSTGAYMLESVAKELAYKTLLCPVSNRPFAMEDVIKLTSSVSGFASTGIVEASNYTPTIV